MLREEIKNIKSTKSDLRKFGLVVGGVFFAIGCLFWWFQKAPAPYFLIFGAALVTSGLIVPGALLPLQKVWMTFGVIMGWFMTRVILCILFYIAFTITGVVARCVGKQFLELKPQHTRKSFWHRRERKEIDKESYERQF